MKFLVSLFSLFLLVKTHKICINPRETDCIQFKVIPGTSCTWMRNYCYSKLYTKNFYFQDGVCTYQEGKDCDGKHVFGESYIC